MSTIKTFVAIGLMIACFAIIYPRFMHPLVLRTLGMSETHKNDIEASDMSHPDHRSMHSEPSRPHQKHGGGRNMGNAPHPGLRAAADMQKQAQQGSGRGMMGIMLPMYAIGIVVYLVYTLFKVFSKSKGNTKQQTQYDNGSGKDASVDRMGFPLDYDGSSDVRSFINDHQQKKELEDLLAQVDNKHVSVNEMRLLQKRLEETEAQMSRILRAMQTVGTNVDEMNVLEDEENSKTKQEDMSPDIESYEVVGCEGVMETENMNGKRDENEIKSKEDLDKEAENANLDINVVKVNQKVCMLKQEVDFDGIDKDSDEEVDYMDDVEEEEEIDNNDEVNRKVEDVTGQSESVDSTIRQRKGKH